MEDTKLITSPNYFIYDGFAFENLLVMVLAIL